MLSPDMAAELEQLRAERDETLRAQKTAQDLRDEYHMLLTEVDRELQGLLGDGAAHPPSTPVVGELAGHLRAARNSCARRRQQLQDECDDFLGVLSMHTPERQPQPATSSSSSSSSAEEGLRQALRQRDEKIAGLEKQCDTYHKAAGDVRKSIVRAQGSADGEELRKQLNDANEKCRLLQERCQRAEEEAAAFFVAGEQVVDLGSELAAARKSSAGHREREQQLASETEQLRTELQSVIKAAEADQSNLERQLRNDAAEARSDCGVLTQELAMVREEKKQLRDAMIELRVEAAGAREDKVELEEAVEQLQRELQATRSEAETSANKLAESEQTVAKLQEEVQQANASAKSVQSEVEGEVSRLRALMKAKEDEYDFLVLDASSKETENGELQEKLSSAKAELSRIQKLLTKTRKDLVKASKDAEKTAKVRTEMRKLEERVQEREAGAEQLVSKAESLRTSLQERDNEIERLRKAASQRSEEPQALRRKLEKMVEMNVRLKRRLQEKQREVLNEPSPSPVVPWNPVRELVTAAAAPPLLDMSDFKLEAELEVERNQGRKRVQPEPDNDEDDFFEMSFDRSKLRKPTRALREHPASTNIQSIKRAKKKRPRTEKTFDTASSGEGDTRGRLSLKI